MNFCLAIFLSVFRMVVIPAQFEDRQFMCTQEEISSNLSIAESYFNDQFKDIKSFDFELAPVVTLPKALSHYGTNYPDRRDVLLHEAVKEACILSDGAVNFSDFSTDGREVDNVIILFAGMSEADGAGPENIWPQQGLLSDHGVSLYLDGKKINSYSVSTELSSDKGENPRPAGIGVLCHEIAHSFGLHDLYDTDFEASGGISMGIWNTGLMDKGSHHNEGHTPPNFNALDMEFLGIGQCDTLKVGSYRLQAINQERKYLKILTDKENEFFLIECRKAEGWDEYIGGSGLLIYHIDRSGNNAGYSDLYGKELTAIERWEKSQINCRPDRQCAYIVTAKPEASEVSQIFFPQAGHDSFGSDTRPAMRFWSGGSSELALTNIVKNSDGSVSFDAIKAIELKDIAVFQDAAIVQWEVSPSLRSIEGIVVEWSDGEKTEYAELTADARSYTIEGLSPQHAYRMKIILKKDKDNLFSLSHDFITKYFREDTYPYIYLSSSDRNSDGSFISGTKLPLRIFNAPDVKEVRWYFNGRAIECEADGYFTLKSSGTLKAELFYENGDSEVIIKEIRI